MYDKVEIRGFRGADDITLDKLGQINILVGKNNVGKSSCLEAISLLASGSAGFQNAFGENSIRQVLGKRVPDDSGLKYLRHVSTAETRITGYKTDGSGSDSVVMVESPYDDLSIDSGLAGKVHSKMLSALKPGESIIGQKYFYFRGGSQTLGALYVTEDGANGVAELDGMGNGGHSGSQSLFVNPHDLVHLHDRLANSEKLLDVIQKLREKHPGVTDIRQIDKTLYVWNGNIPIPFSLTGDGFQASLVITAVTHALERGVLVLEEPENSMHPGLVFGMVYELLSACKNGEMQIFLSSHSDELVKSVLEMQVDTSVSVHHMLKLDNETLVRSFQLDDAKERRLVLDIDLRGL